MESEPGLYGRVDRRQWPERSQGPKTAADREKSSRNALKHGFTSRKLVRLECEDSDAFKEFLAEYAETYKPANAAEQHLVDEMIAARWRMRAFG
jgi:hypothetical protein